MEIIRVFFNEVVTHYSAFIFKKINDTDCVLTLEGASLQLDGVINNSDNYESPNILIITNPAIAHMLFVFGGEAAYLIDLSTGGVKAVPTARQYIDEEFWFDSHVMQDDHLILIYEAGLMVMNRLFTRMEYFHKYYDEFFDGLENNLLWLVNSDGERRSMLLPLS